MYFELKENKPHGTKDDPFSTYHIKNEGRSFQIPVHWHDELEIIYVKSGFLTVSISGENYIGTPGDAFVVSPGNLHFMGSQTDTVDYFTFLFPLKYISFCINDMLDDKLLEPLKNGHLMISPRVKDTAKELCEQLVEIYVAKNKKTESIKFCCIYEIISFSIVFLPLLSFSITKPFSHISRINCKRIIFVFI